MVPWAVSLGSTSSSPSQVECAGCEKTIWGRYFQWGKNPEPYCSTCIKIRFCLKCDKPAIEFLVHEDHDECLHCAAVLPSCCYCGTSQINKWWMVDEYILCEPCGRKSKNFGICHGCGELNNRSKHRWCSACSTDTVYPKPPERLDALLADVLTFLKDEFQMEVEQYCKLTLVTAAQFKKKGWNSIGLYTRRGDVRNIYLEEGLPEPLFMAALAHEAVHAWQEENCPRQTEVLSEGLASWIEFKVYQAQDVFDPGEWFEKSLTGSYLKGFQKCRQKEQRLGEAGLLRAVQDWQRFPS